MRDIKFRAWDKVRKLMQYPDEIWVKKNSQWNCVNRVNGFAISETDNLNGELMQFTGLHDKNGKDIYEGDIVRFTTISPSGEYGDPLPVHISTMYGARPYLRGVGGFPNWVPLLSEIIGNIHENPELLTKQQAG